MAISDSDFHDRDKFGGEILAESPAILYSKRLDLVLCAKEAEIALRIMAEQKGPLKELKSWINFPLMNRTGKTNDLSLKHYAGYAKPTAYAARMSNVMSFVETLAGEGLSLMYVRIAVLLNRDVLRPHVDMYPSNRLLVPLNEQGEDFRHVFGNLCIVMRTGELWGVNGRVCHGAANISNTGYRVMLLIDARAESDSDNLPGWFKTKWDIPRDSLIKRARWTQRARDNYYRHTKRIAIELGNEEAEREWLFAPFEYAMPAAQVYSELVTFCRWMAQDAEIAKAQAQSVYWLQRAVCLSTPSLGFEVAPPNNSFSPTVQ